MQVRPPKLWASTIRLSKTTFPYRATPKAQAKYLKRCTDDLYAWQKQNRSASAPFVLHDGPPYANGSLHIGHALNKILKDIICRTELHQGQAIKFVPGWDCHGLPIEIKALEQHREENPNGGKLDAVGVRQAARRLATSTVREQKKDFRQWAIMADWDNAWSTKNRTYEIKQLEVFREMVRRNIIFRRFKPVYWSPSSRTALAEAELEYKVDHVSTAAYVKFPILDIPQSLIDQGIIQGRLHALIWTTTPWTLPANQAIAVNPDLDYIVVSAGKEQYLIAESRFSDLVQALKLYDFRTERIACIKGRDLGSAKYANPLRGSKSKPQPILIADFVSADSGTGLVHCAPGHGMEDYELCTKTGIPAFAPVDDAGCFTDAAYPEAPAALTGRSVMGDGNTKVIELLSDQVLLVHKYKHKYPYDWRTKLPVIVRATEQWFANIEGVRELAITSLENVQFIPDYGKDRLVKFMMGRSEWCISRQRAWGVPIPALYDGNGVAILTDESVSHIVAVIADRGIDAWWTDAEDDPAWIAPSLDGSFRRGKDTMDVWFDSGTSWTQTEGQADVYCEGTDQHRGWFQSSLLTHVAMSGVAVAPFRRLITHGFALDKEGKKMSKSIGNVISPREIMEGTLLLQTPVKKKAETRQSAPDALGPDALRLWVASSFYTHDVLISTEVLQTVQASMHKYRKTIRMLLMSMHEAALSAPLTTLDKIALVQIDKAMMGVLEAWQTYEFHTAVAVINLWVNNDLSAFYLEGIKDRLYCGDGGSILHHAFHGFLQMLAPITPLLVEEAWDHRPDWMKKAESQSGRYPFHQTLSPDNPLGIPRSLYISVEPDIAHLLAANSAIKKAQEAARAQNHVGSSLQSHVVLDLPNDNAKALFQKYEADLADIFVVSSVALNGPTDGLWAFQSRFEVPGGGVATAWVLPPGREKCPRCWRWAVDKDRDGKSEEGLCGRCEEVVGPVLGKAGEGN